MWSLTHKFTLRISSIHPDYDEFSYLSSPPPVVLTYNKSFDFLMFCPISDSYYVSSPSTVQHYYLYNFDGVTNKLLASQINFRDNPGGGYGIKYHYNGFTIPKQNKLFMFSTQYRNIYDINLNTAEIITISSVTPTNDNGVWQYNPFTDLVYHYSGGTDNTNRLYVFDYKTRTVTSVQFTSSTLSQNSIYSTVVHPNGKVYGIPGTQNVIYEFDPFTNTTTKTFTIDPLRQSSSLKWQGQVVQFDGRIYQQPFESNVILEFDPQTGEQKYYGNFSGSQKWGPQIVLPDKEHIVFLPVLATQVLIFNYRTKSWTLISSSYNRTFNVSLQKNGKLMFTTFTSDLRTMYVYELTKTTTEYETQSSFFIPEDYEYLLFNSEIGMNFVHKLFNIFDPDDNRPIKRVIRRLTQEQLRTLGNKFQLPLPSPYQNNPYLYEVYLVKGNDFTKIRLPFVSSISSLSNSNCHYDSSTQTITFQSTLVDSMTSNDYISIETVGKELFSDTKTLTGLPKFVINSDTDEDRIKVKKLFYINPDQNVDHLNVSITSSDIFPENFSQATWLEFSLDGKTWSKSINLGNIEYDKKVEFYVRGTVPSSTSPDILSRYLDVQLTVIRDELSKI